MIAKKFANMWAATGECIVDVHLLAQSLTMNTRYDDATARCNLEPCAHAREFLCMYIYCTRKKVYIQRKDVMKLLR